MALILVRQKKSNDGFALVARADVQLEVVIAGTAGAGDDDPEKHGRGIQPAAHSLGHEKHVMENSGVVVAVARILDGLLHDGENGRRAGYRVFEVLAANGKHIVLHQIDENAIGDCLGAGVGVDGDV
ncbi:MAG: hypothetical protein WA049_20410 [Ferribacterium limneticum]